jgi:8-oxo-dGTP pyrophosphatase MutT (NUDIX family)
MYKIYINKKVLLLTSKSETFLTDQPLKILHKRYYGDRKLLEHLIAQLEGGTHYDQIEVLAKNPKELYKILKSYMVPVKAGGGLVFNNNGHLLTIFRNGHWDLPKGKIEPGESRKSAAIREVQEECGVENIFLAAKAAKTYHVFNKKKKRILKISHWYFMFSDQKRLTPQINEGIENAVWLDTKKVFDLKYNFYPNLKNLLLQVDFAAWKKKAIDHFNDKKSDNGKKK